MIPPDLDLSWPPKPETMALLAEAGVGDRQAAKLFGVNFHTFRGYRRAWAKTRPGARADWREGPEDFGFDPVARWPAGVRFDGR